MQPGTPQSPEPTDAQTRQAAHSVAEAWKDHWDKSEMRPDSSWQGRALRRYVASFGGFSSTRFILGILKRHLGDVRGRKILDAGSGTGLNSLALAARGADVTLLDIAPQALEIARRYFSELGLEGKFVEGSIFELPFPDRTFDIVWNTGVVEHFEPATRKLAVQEMLRVMKPGGTLITINPNARARIYRFAKERAEKSGSWDVGFELPIETLREDIDLGTYAIQERSMGWFMQIHFLKYLLPKPLRIVFTAAHEGAQCVVNALNFFPGYLLVTVIRRR